MLLAALILAAAALAGLKLSVRAGPALTALSLILALGWVRRRHWRPGGDRRLACGADVVLLLFQGGIAGGLICLVGQTFAMPFIDPLLSRCDQTLGVDLEAFIAGMVQVRGSGTLLAVAYNSSFPLLFIVALCLAWKGRFDEAWRLCGIFNMCLLIATVSSAVIPAVGPFHYLPISASIQNALPPGSGTYHLADLFALRHADQFVIDPSRLQGVATFPSFHTALALMTAAACRDLGNVRLPIFVWQGLVILSTIPIGGHYVVDLIGGAVCWAAAQHLWLRNSLRTSGCTARRPGALRSS
jgi:membrane-associated phospholipid phosphatase